MINLYDIAYSAGLIVTAPLWLTRPTKRRKVIGALQQRMGLSDTRITTGPAVMIHAVSVGEMNATPRLVDRLRELRPGLQFIISTTTQTGHERAIQLYGSHPDATVVYYPLDFSIAINRLFKKTRPSAVVLLELELWPNFLHQCQRRNIPVLLVNGRMTTGSFRNLSKFRWLAKKMLGGLQYICAQDADYARQFIALGASPDTVQITGTMKFDTANVGGQMQPDLALGRAVGLEASAPVWVCGSTGPGEEALILDAYQCLLPIFSDLRLVIVPRKPERFDDVAALIQSRGFGLVRRSQPGSEISANKPVVILGDTMGELRRFYSLATIVFVGRSLVDLGHRQHGSDMIEPAALAKPIIVGPFTTNFADAMRWFRASSALREVATVDQLVEQMEQLLHGPEQAAAMGHRARQVVIDQQGATERHARLIAQVLADRPASSEGPHPQKKR